MSITGTSLAILVLIFSSCVWFYPEFLDCSASGSWATKHCHIWTTSHGMALKLKNSVFDHFHKFCATIIPAHFKERTDCRLMVLCMHWCPSPTAESFVLLQKTTDSNPLLGAFTRVTLTDSKKLLFYQISTLPQNYLPAEYSKVTFKHLTNSF